MTNSLSAGYNSYKSQELPGINKIKCISFKMRLEIKTLFLVDTETTTATTTTTTTTTTTAASTTTTTAASTTAPPKKCE